MLGGARPVGTVLGACGVPELLCATNELMVPWWTRRLQQQRQAHFKLGSPRPATELRTTAVLDASPVVMQRATWLLPRAEGTAHLLLLVPPQHALLRPSLSTPSPAPSFALHLPPPSPPTTTTATSSITHAALAGRRPSRVHKRSSLSSAYPAGRRLMHRGSGLAGLSLNRW